MQYCDLDLMFDLAVTLNILSELYLGNCKVKEVDTWLRCCLGGVGVPPHAHLKI